MARITAGEKASQEYIKAHIDDKTIHLALGYLARGRNRGCIMSEHPFIFDEDDIKNTLFDADHGCIGFLAVESQYGNISQPALNGWWTIVLRDGSWGDYPYPLDQPHGPDEWWNHHEIAYNNIKVAMGKMTRFKGFGVTRKQYDVLLRKLASDKLSDCIKKIESEIESRNQETFDKNAKATALLEQLGLIAQEFSLK
ncbi:hypothetical protein FWF93_01220 [Candidatus Saccharibacteria bacterium]|nr:hypothetical protein [Candidatus Saccharibacteria bacterium]